MINQQAFLSKAIKFFTASLFTFIIFGLNAQNNVVDEFGCSTLRLPFSFDVESAWTSQPGYSIDNRHTPLAGDIDGDGLIEVLCMGTDKNHIYVFDGQTGNWVGTAQTTDNVDGESRFGPIVIHRPAKNTKAVLFVSDIQAKTMTLFEVSSASGIRPITFDIKWTKTNVPFITPVSIRNITTMPIVADFDGDGVAEFFTGGLFIDVETGNVLDTVPVIGVGGWGVSFPMAADIDRDGNPELIAGTMVYKFSRNADPRVTTYAACPGLPQQEGVNMVADIDQNGIMDVIYHNAHDHSGNAYIKVWTPETGGVLGDFTIAKSSYRSYPFVGDIDGEINSLTGKKHPEICINTVNQLYAYSYTGSGFTQKWVMNHTDGTGATSLTLYDFNLDGTVELVYRDERNLNIFDGSGSSVGQPLASFPATSSTLNETPIVADVTGAGSANLIVTGGSSIMVFKGQSSKWAACPNVWNQQLYSPLTANNDLTIPSTVLSGDLTFTQTCEEYQGNVVQYYNGGPMQAPYVSAVSYCPIDPSADPFLIEGEMSVSGSSITFSFSVNNQGVVALSNSMPIAFYQNSMTSSNLIGTATLGINLLAGDTINLVKTFSITGNPTQFFIRLLDDGINFPALGDYSDCDLTNNIKAFGTLEITKTIDENTACLNSVKIFTITVTNNELFSREDILVIDSLGVGWEFISVTSSMGTTVGNYNTSTRQIEWIIPSLPTESSVQLLIVARVIATGTLRNVAWIEEVDGISQSRTERAAYAVVVAEEAPDPPIITMSGELCTGDSEVILSATGTGEFQWFLNYIPILDATGPTYIATLPGTYHVTTSNGICTSNLGIPIEVQMEGYPEVDPITGPTKLCVNQMVTWHNTTLQGGTWKISNTSMAVIQSATTNSVTIKGLAEGIIYLSYKVGTVCQTIITQMIKILPEGSLEVQIGF